MRNSKLLYLHFHFEILHTYLQLTVSIKWWRSLSCINFISSVQRDNEKELPCKNTKKRDLSRLTGQIFVCLFVCLFSLFYFLFSWYLAIDWEWLRQPLWRGSLITRAGRHRLLKWARWFCLFVLFVFVLPILHFECWLVRGLMTRSVDHEILSSDFDVIILISVVWVSWRSETL